MNYIKYCDKIVSEFYFWGNIMLKKINDNYIFEEIVVLLLAFIGLIFWYYRLIYGITSLLVIGSLLAIVFNDFKYMAPATIFSIFTLGEGISPDAHPIPLFIAAGVAIISMVIFTIRNGFNIKKIKSAKGLLLLSVLSILPLFWHNIIKPENNVMYILYFAYLIYFIVYVFFVINLNDKSFRMICLTFSYLAIILFFECFLTVYNMHLERPGVNILSFAYFLGWGVCNEAGIMLCFSMPFIAILLLKAEDLPHIIINVLKSALLMFGIIFTTSRGSYLFGAIMAVALFILIMIFAKHKIKILITSLITLCVSILIFYFAFDKIDLPKFINDVKDFVFYNKFDDNGRKDLWNMATNIWKQNFLTITFGNGIVAEYYNANSATGYREVFVVYHSTFYEALATVGIIGVIALLIHFIEKYLMLFKFELSVALVMLFGYLILDIYGMIDNTYGMYYFMGPLVISMASIDNLSKKQELIFN